MQHIVPLLWQLESIHAVVIPMESTLKRSTKLCCCLSPSVLSSGQPLCWPLQPELSIRQLTLLSDWDGDGVQQVAAASSKFYSIACNEWQQTLNWILLRVLVLVFVLSSAGFLRNQCKWKDFLCLSSMLSVFIFGLREIDIDFFLFLIFVLANFQFKLCGFCTFSHLFHLFWAMWNCKPISLDRELRFGLCILLWHLSGYVGFKAALWLTAK